MRHGIAATDTSNGDRYGRPALAMLRAAADTTASAATAVLSRRHCCCSRRLLSRRGQRRIVRVGRGRKTLLEVRQLLSAHKLVNLAVGYEAETQRAVVVVRAGRRRRRSGGIGALVMRRFARGGRAQCVLCELLLVCEHAHRLVEGRRVLEISGECGDRVVVGGVAAADTAAVSAARAAAGALRWLRLRV
jgi:hypothetical protein